MSESIEYRDYFVDEAGCLTFFDKYGRIIVGSEGVSKVFLVGVAHISDIHAASRKLHDLRTELLSDP